MKLLFNHTPKSDFLDVAALLLRLFAGGFMLTHGIPKFEKYINGDVQFADPFGFGAEITLLLAIATELFCSLLIMVGFATRLATIPVMLTMATAAFIVHADDPFSKKEMGLLYLALFALVFILGSGKFSLDYVISKAAEDKKKKRKSYKSSRPKKLDTSPDKP